MVLRVLRGEGLAAARDRALDRLAERRRRRSFAPVAAPPPGLAWPVLRVAAGAPVARLGGVQAQLGARLAEEELLGPVALLYPEPAPEPAGYRLELAAGPPSERRWTVALPGAPPSPVALADVTFERAVRRAAELAGARTVHVEGVAGLPLRSLLALRTAGLRLVLSLHDFGLFCARPHLLEHPDLRFCDYCDDLARCARCLRQTWPLDAADQAERRAVAGELLAAAEIAVFPSEFLLEAHRGLFGEPPGGDWRVIPPAASPARPLLSAAGPRPVRHVALVGGLQVHKGALVFAEVAQRLQGRGLRFTAYGGGDAGIAARLRRLPGVAVRGYYRAGSLPSLLRRDRVDLALLPSIVQESYSLVLTECLAAGVPVLAFDQGALGERLRRGGGLLAPPGSGATGLAALVEEVLAGAPVPPPPVDAGMDAAPAVAGRWLDLWRGLGLAPG